MCARRKILLFLALWAAAGSSCKKGSWDRWRADDTERDREEVQDRTPSLKRRMLRLNGAYGEFESANIGHVRRHSRYKFTLSLRGDNGNENLPPYWRQWWYMKLDVPTDRPVTLRLRGRGHWNYYHPVYSFDDESWHWFEKDQVTQPSRHMLVMRKRFRRSPVWLARFPPYPFSRLVRRVKAWRQNPSVKVGSLGRSPLGFQIPYLTVTDRRVASRRKNRVMIHARTHPGEVGSSFIVEGLMGFLTGNAPAARRLRRRLIFHVVPMLNVDGVVLGNNRVTPRGVNLEGKWETRPKSPFDLEPDVPREVRLLHRQIRRWMADDGPFAAALNLHASNGQPEDGIFFFPHFGPAAAGYDRREQRLWYKQVRFVRLLKRLHGPQWFNPLPGEGGRQFLPKDVPESWWWRARGSRVMALTLEATYGKAGPHSRWMRPRDFFALGRSVALALGPYVRGSDASSPPDELVVRKRRSAAH